ncbi:hypothetical protein O181_054910 [Austropuccinia psidii MF-1]|uniref:GAG-pre-integrase domain-containing protein n=1 Tax=Austropuccinia psidii MF-1 TaxID=1389203 RepID=A0A9Q3E9P9_9BASI|nr:hypothetical protein [Austropuccinia psidii MF-1]
MHTLQLKQKNQLISSDSYAFIVKEDESFSLKNRNRIHIDSGSCKSVVNYLKYLNNPVDISHRINTYGTTFLITHQGTLFLKGIKISPVYYTPRGLVNLLSVSQLFDHNIRSVIKNDWFILKKGQTNIAAFKREGNLFVRKTIFTNRNEKDWHAILGHLSDNYVRKLLDKNQIKGNFVSRDFIVLPEAKIQNWPHTCALPLSNLAFHCLHVDTLEIQPATNEGIKYILVIINDYTYANQSAS